MKLTFYKFQGTGNDFVMIDNRQGIFNKDNTKLVAFLCDRKFGIGADGLILLEDEPGMDFKMVYYNSDGNQSTMCGNGGRCLVAFAAHLNVVEDKATFNAVDGLHYATISDDVVSLQMTDVDEVKIKPNATFLDTGSPHHVQLVANIDDYAVKTEGAKLRYGIYGEKGSNINFVEPTADKVFKVRTYERGVEDETLSCGTGVTAVAIAMHKTGKTADNEIKISAPGGHLKVKFDVVDEKYTNVHLIGPAKFVFKGEIDV
ncbi:diaminopimelate epimerase [Cellulophaga baltica]|uniref:diaminopimelate epimerase n=1 Tax=Cellulophaga TaxID=104264 RepID=UPI001C0723DF|nr:MULTISPECIES: diaminopimelate epimerase [Cellulophaga]MBU2996008.1 diaminopimelate epimerase [Cellulophaga baltica]MDO6767403.1 diaminopimelate epimerase [Cellulophaga sp. 1_MG-2023]